MDPIIAVDKTTHQLRKVSDVDNGMKCNCICSECGGALEACQGDYRQYFRHHSNDRKCTGSWESQLHLLAKYIIEQNKSIALPNWGGKYLVFPARKQEFADVQVEISQDELKPDCLCTYVDEKGVKKTLWVEILNTHAVDPDKTRKIKERGVACVEIDVSGLFPDKEINEDVLKDFLLNHTENRHWINNPDGEAQEAYYINEAKQLYKQNNIIKYIEDHSADSKSIIELTYVCYYFFIQKFSLNAQTHDFLYDYISFYRNRINLRSQQEQQFFISAIQFLYCNQCQLNRYRLHKYTKEAVFYAFSIDRKGVIEDLSRCVPEVLKPGKY